MNIKIVSLKDQILLLLQLGDGDTSRLTNIKIVSLKDQILLLFQLGDRDISRLTSLHPSSHLQSLLAHMQTFYSEVKSFTKMEINLVG